MSDIVRWITVSGVHIPIRKDESKMSVVKEYIKRNVNRDKEDKADEKTFQRVLEEDEKEGFSPKQFWKRRSEIYKEEYKKLNPTIKGLQESKGQYKMQDSTKKPYTINRTSKNALLNNGKKTIYKDANGKDIKIGDIVEGVGKHQYSRNGYTGGVYHSLFAVKQRSTGKIYLETIGKSIPQSKGPTLTKNCIIVGHMKDPKKK